jgi:RimJ/RimL family protein N-acetyltransferase
VCGVLKPEYPITTERLLLRPLDPATDVDAVHAYQSREDVCRYVPYHPRSRQEVAERLADPERTRSALENEGEVIDLAVVERDTGRLVGDVVLFWRSAEHRAGEIGYAFNPAFHGRGYATEASRALLDLAFGGLGLHRVIARVDARNAASAAVLRRLGMRQEAVLVENEWFKGEWTTEIDFAVLETEWRAGSRQRGGEVGQQIVGVLDADREPDQVGRHLER